MREVEATSMRYRAEDTQCLKLESKQAGELKLRTGQTRDQALS